MPVIGHSSYIEVDLGAIKSNLGALRKLLGPAVRILACVKADGYGHGAPQVAKAALEAGCDYLGVAFASEGIELRECGLLRSVPILLMCNSAPDEAESIVHYNLTPTIATLELANALELAAARQNTICRAHIKVDSGLGRGGIASGEALKFIKKLIDNYPHIKLEGIYTHLAYHNEQLFTKYQLDKFRRLLAKLHKNKINLSVVHAANSSITLRLPQARFDLVRIGLILYGIEPFEGAGKILKLSPALQLKSRILQLKWLPRGHGISYERTFILKRRSLVANVPIGYADGYSWYLSNCAKVLVNGEFVPVIGRVCMDQLMIDVTSISDKVKVGSEVVLIGGCGNNHITVNDLASWAKTIPHHIVATLGKRLNRVYKNEPAG